MKILVCGGRDYTDRANVFAALDAELAVHGDDLIIIHGDCKTGTDKFADEWTTEREVDCVRVRAKWTKYGGRAGPMRNRRMWEKYRPDKVIATKGGDGTAYMISLVPPDMVTRI